MKLLKKYNLLSTHECTGCNLCIPACPADCMVNDGQSPIHFNKHLAKTRYLAKQQRTQKQAVLKPQGHTLSNQDQKIRTQKQTYIEAARLRVQQRKDLT